MIIQPLKLVKRYKSIPGLPPIRVEALESYKLKLWNGFNPLTFHVHLTDAAVANDTKLCTFSEHKRKLFALGNDIPTMMQ